MKIYALNHVMKGRMKNVLLVIIILIIENIVLLAIVVIIEMTLIQKNANLALEIYHILIIIHIIIMIIIQIYFWKLTKNI